LLAAKYQPDFKPDIIALEPLVYVEFREPFHVGGQVDLADLPRVEDYRADACRAPSKGPNSAPDPLGALICWCNKKPWPQ
jgi:hypothetical protein